MTFPLLAVLDDGARANENPLSHGGAWSTPLIPGDFNSQLLTNVITSAGTGWTSAYWNTRFGADQEVFGTTAAGGTDFLLFARCSNPNTGGEFCGYRFTFQPTTNLVIIDRFDANVTTRLHAGLPCSFNNLDTIGVRAVGPLFEFFANGTKTSEIDDDYYETAPGFIGCGSFFNTGNGFSSFGGGELAAGRRLDLSSFPAAKVLVR